MKKFVSDVLCLNQSCADCRPSDYSNVAICSCGASISSKYCYKEQPTQTGYSVSLIDV